MRRKTLYVIPLFWFLAVAGCGNVGYIYRTYSGPELPEDKICFLVRPSPISITSLDNCRAETSWSTWKKAVVSSDGIWAYRVVELLPGSHNLTVSFHYEKVYRRKTRVCSSKGDVPLTFVGKPGHIYAIRPDYWEIAKLCSSGQKSWQPRIEDITNSQYANEEIMPQIRKHKANLRN